MALSIIFAFAAGIVTILSPCILPILPIILSSTATGGKLRPWGIVTGFVASFTFFTLFLSSLVRAFGISADVLRTFSVVVIFVFGLSLVIPQFQALLEQLFARLSKYVPNTATKSGFSGGLLIGLSLGLLWTPCVGPILASVISLALTGTITGTAIAITLAYSLGTAIPMFIIILTGRSLISRLPNPARIQQVFGVLMILTAIAIYFNIDRRFQTLILDTFPNYGTNLTQFENLAIPKNDMLSPMLSAPDIIPGGQWFNSPPLSLKDLKGKVVLIDFWTYTCINCIRTLPYVQAWHEKYQDQGLVIIGVHTPEFEFEKNPANVKKAIADFGLTYPIVQDNAYATWTAYANHYWPAKYFIDRTGKIVSSHFGEGDYDESEALIQKLLSVSQPIANPTYTVSARTPELYVGSDRFDPNYIKFTGVWTDFGEYREPQPNAILTVQYTARRVFLVMRPKSTEPGIVKVFLDNTHHSTITVNADKLYTLLELPNPDTHNLKLEFPNGNLQLFAFTFG